MERRLVEAEPDLARHLTWLSARDPVKRRMVRGEMWELRKGVWMTERDMPELHEMRRNGRAPVIMSSDTIEAVVRAKAARPSESDIGDACKGCEPVEVVALTGETRVDYPNVPLKNADGTLNKYAKNMLDLHAPAIRAGEEAAHKLKGLAAKVLEAKAS